MFSVCSKQQIEPKADEASLQMRLGCDNMMIPRFIFVRDVVLPPCCCEFYSMLLLPLEWPSPFFLSFLSSIRRTVSASSVISSLSIMAPLAGLFPWRVAWLLSTNCPRPWGDILTARVGSFFMASACRSWSCPQGVSVRASPVSSIAVYHGPRVRTSSASIRFTSSSWSSVMACTVSLSLSKPSPRNILNPVHAPSPANLSPRTARNPTILHKKEGKSKEKTN